MADDRLHDLFDFAERVQQPLQALFPRARAELRQPGRGDDGNLLLDAIEDLTLRGGKRLRPYLAWRAALCIRDEAEVSGLLPACAALELLQSYLLIHDDIMDGDDVRRGGPTVHRLLAGGEPRRGEMLAILAGDLAATLARKALQFAGVPDERRLRALDELTLMEWEVIQGQTLDLTGSPDVQTMHDLKTGSYTTRGPVRFGAALAGAGEAQVETLVAFATPLGLAFQLRDDLLDMTGDPDRTGKAVGIDLREGRVSAVIDEALGRADAALDARIRAAWGRLDVTDATLADAVHAVVQSGAVDACGARIRALTDEAIVALDRRTLRDEGRQGLVQIARALAARAG